MHLRLGLQFEFLHYHFGLVFFLIVLSLHCSKYIIYVLIWYLHSTSTLFFS